MAKQPKRQAQPEMIRCENCGELYSDTYRCCPFCDERPGRRVDDYKRNPLQIAVLLVTLLVILAAAFIVISKVAPLLSSREPGQQTEVTTPTDGNKPIIGSDLVPKPTEGEEAPTDPSEVPTEREEDNTVPAVAIVLSREDITLLPGESYTLTATVAPANTTNLLVWACDKPDVLSIDQNGTITNKNTTGEKVAVTLTALAGKVKAECIVRCNSAAGSSQPSTPSTGTDTPSTPSTPTVTKTDAKVVGAGSGLNVRSGPGSNYEKVASIQNGNSVVILEDTGNGWYKIDYGNGKTGYASSQFIQPK